MELENNLKAARKKLKITQLELAQKVGVSRQSIYAIESSKSEPSLSLALKIARSLDSSVEKIFWLTGSNLDDTTEEISPFTIF